MICNKTKRVTLLFLRLNDSWAKSLTRWNLLHWDGYHQEWPLLQKPLLRLNIKNRVIEISRHGDDSIVNDDPEASFRSFLRLVEVHRRYFFGRLEIKEVTTQLEGKVEKKRHNVQILFHRWKRGCTWVSFIILFHTLLKTLESDWTSASSNL